MKKFFSCCMVGFFVIALSLVIGLFAVKRIALNPNFHKNNLRKTHFYEQSLQKFPPFIAQVLSNNNQQSGGTAKTAQQTSEDAQSALLVTTFAKSIEGSVQPAWLQTQTESIIDGVFGYMKGKNNALSIVIPMSPIKTALGSSVTSALQEQFNNLPTCTAAQIKQGGQSAGTECKPPGVKASDFDKALSDPKSNPFANIPDQYDLGQQLTKNSQSLKTLRTFYSVTNILFWLSFIVGLLSVGLIFLMNLKSIGNAMKVIGIPTIVVSALNLVSTLLSYLSTGFISTQIKNSGSLGTDLLTLISDVLTNNIEAILNLSLIISIILLVVGIILVIIGAIISKNATPIAKANPSPPPPATPVK